MAVQREVTGYGVPHGAAAWKSYLALGRPGHWVKNLLVLPGAGFAAVAAKSWSSDFFVQLGTAMVAICLVSSANYVLNEWLDARSDAFHPDKRHRPSVGGLTRAPMVYLEYAALLGAGLLIGYLVNLEVLVTLIVLWLMGVVYNVPPLRTKDQPILDVLSEAINNPIRLLLGWFAVAPTALPPSSFVVGYWMTGAFLMSVKRYSELRYLGAGEIAASYRRSFRYYTESSLLIAIMFYACCASFLLGVILIKYRVELLITMPFLAFAFAWYLRIGMLPDSAAQRPELLYKEWRFMIYLLFVALLVCGAFAVDMPWLNWTLTATVRGF